MGRASEGACKALFKKVFPVYQNLVHPLIGQFLTVAINTEDDEKLDERKYGGSINSSNVSRQVSKSGKRCVEEELVDCLENLVAGRDVFAILPTGLGNGVLTITYLLCCAGEKWV